MSEPDPKRRRLLKVDGDIADEETARQKMRDAKVYKRGATHTGLRGNYDGFDPDNVGDIRSFCSRGFNRSLSKMSLVRAMGYFAKDGDLSMMRWLYVNGADTRDVDVANYFPMWIAAANGRLDACKWLFAHGAAKDVRRRTREHEDYPNGRSALLVTFGKKNKRDLSQWLILNGALCKDDDSGELDVEITKQDLASKYLNHFVLVQEREALLEWANDLHGARTSFLLFLSGALSTPKHTYCTRRNKSQVRILSGESGVFELISDYVGIVRGREACIVRQLTELLPDLNKELDSE